MDYYGKIILLLLLVTVACAMILALILVPYKTSDDIPDYGYSLPTSTISKSMEKEEPTIKITEVKFKPVPLKRWKPSPTDTPLVIEPSPEHEEVVKIEDVFPFISSTPQPQPIITKSTKPKPMPPESTPQEENVPPTAPVTSTPAEEPAEEPVPEKPVSKEYVEPTITLTVDGHTSPIEANPEGIVLVAWNVEGQEPFKCTINDTEVAQSGEREFSVLGADSVELVCIGTRSATKIKKSIQIIHS